MKIYQVKAKIKNDHYDLFYHFTDYHEASLLKLLMIGKVKAVNIESREIINILESDTHRYIHSLLYLKQEMGLIYALSSADSSFYFRRKGDSHFTRLSTHLNKQSMENKICVFYNDLESGLNWIRNKI